MNPHICNKHLSQADTEERILNSKHNIYSSEKGKEWANIWFQNMLHIAVGSELWTSVKPHSTHDKRHPEKDWSGLLPEIQKLQEEKERLKDACSKGQRTAEKLAKENYSLHNEIQGHSNLNGFFSYLKKNSVNVFKYKRKKKTAITFKPLFFNHLS